MSEKSNGTDSESRKPIQTFRRGAIGGSIWRKQSSTGLTYCDFSLSRSWKSTSTGKDGYSTSFFDHNRDELKAVIDECCDYIEEYGLAHGPDIELDQGELIDSA